jgi:hypothetical protein
MLSMGLGSSYGKRLKKEPHLELFGLLFSLIGGVKPARAKEPTPPSANGSLALADLLALILF